MTPQAAAALAEARLGVTGLRRITPDRAGDTHVFDSPQGIVKVWAAPEKAQAQLARQAAVAGALEMGAHRAPRVLLDAAPAALLERAEGRAARGLFTETGDLALLTRAGAWAAALHRTSLREVHFKPEGLLNWATRLRREAASGMREMRDAGGFAAASDTLFDMAARVRKRRVFRAITHRDLHLGNLVLGEAVWGLDFENDREDWALRDLFSLGIDAMACRPDLAPAPIMAALAQGYGPERGKDGPRLFLQRAFALGVWANTPPRPSRRQEAAWQAAQWMLATSDPVI